MLMLTFTSTSTANGPKIKSHFQIPLRSASPNPTHAFLSGLHLFAAALITHYTNMRALHSRRAMYLLQNNPSKAMSSPMKLPAIFVRLSSLLPSKNKSPRTGKAWAKDVLKVTFQGLESSSQRPVVAGSLPSLESHVAPSSAVVPADTTNADSPDEKAVIVAEASMSTPMPSGLLINQRVDRDIAFHPSSGAFAFRLQSKVGEAAIVGLTERLQRVEQFVDFVQVVKQHDKTLHCETVSLGKVVFTYGLSSVPSSPQADIDAMTLGRQGLTYRATVNFAGITSPLTLALEAGNPHIRILDHLTKVLNSPVGLEGVATLIPLTLPVLRGLDAIEEAWISHLDKGEVLVFNRAADWYTIRYTLGQIPISTPADSQQKPRRVTLDIHLQHRNGVPWWCIRRARERDAPPADEIDIALKTVWDGNGEGMRWRGMQNAGIATREGIEELLARVDGCMREVIISGAPPAPIKVQLPSPGVSESQDQGQAQSQIQGNGQGQQHTDRNGSTHEMIVID